MRDYGAEISERAAKIENIAREIPGILSDARREIDRPADGFIYCGECVDFGCKQRIKGRRAGCFEGVRENEEGFAVEYNSEMDKAKEALKNRTLEKFPRHNCPSNELNRAQTEPTSSPTTYIENPCLKCKDEALCAKVGSRLCNPRSEVLQTTINKAAEELKKTEKEEFQKECM